MSPALGVYLLASRLAGPLAEPVLRRRLARGKEDKARLGERLGRPGLARPEGRLVWLHGASVGEAASMLPLIDALRGAAPGIAILATSGTVTSARRMAETLPEGAMHQYLPVDTAGAVAEFLDHWRPDLAVWIEGEIWPRLVHETARRGVPMALVNARLSARSFGRWRRLPGMARALFGAFGLIVAQDRGTVERLAGLSIAAEEGVNLKALVSSPGCDEAELARLREALEDRRCWLAASTHPGEEEIVAEAISALRGALPGVLTIIAPRHPERGAELAAMLTKRGLVAARRSLGEAPSGDVYLADTLGEMGLWYRLAPVALVGGSLVAMGGHTPYEPAALGCAILHGPHLANFAPGYAALDAAGGAREVGNAAALADAVRELLGEDGPAARMAAAARAVRDGLAADLGPLARRLLALAP